MNANGDGFGLSEGRLEGDGMMLGLVGSKALDVELGLVVGVGASDGVLLGCALNEGTLDGARLG